MRVGVDLKTTQKVETNCCKNFENVLLKRQNKFLKSIVGSNFDEK